MNIKRKVRITVQSQLSGQRTGFPEVAARHGCRFVGRNRPKMPLTVLPYIAAEKPDQPTAHDTLF